MLFKTHTPDATAEIGDAHGSFKGNTDKVVKASKAAKEKQKHAIADVKKISDINNIESKIKDMDVKKL